MGSFWAGSAGDVHDPAHHGKVADQRRELDNPRLAETGGRFGEGGIADPVPAHQFNDEIDGACFVDGELLGAPPCCQRVDRLRGNARLDG